MDFAPLFDLLGEPVTIVLGAAVIGLAFGIAAQRSRFCLRSAVIDVTGTAGDGTRWQRLALWLLVFGAAVAATQALILSGLLEVGNVRQFTGARSLSGVLIGGALFGIGMTLTRGCVSRLTVLAANGNMRAVVSLAIFAGVAYTTFAGALAPLRQVVLGLWTLGPDANLNLLSQAGFGPRGGIVAGIAIAIAAIVLARLVRLKIFSIAFGGLIALTIAAGWWLTWSLSGQVFEPIAVESISFTRPAIDAIAYGASGFAVSELGFGIGIVAGVLLGSFLAAVLTGGLKFQWFDSLASAGRYAAGAALMGFGGVLAGGCSVGAGLTGGVLFALAPLTALAAMIAGSALTDIVLNRAGTSARFGRTKAVPAE